MWRRDARLRVRPARKSNMRRLSYQRRPLRTIVIDPERAPLVYGELRLKEYDHTRDGEWVNGIPNGIGHSIAAARYAMINDD